MDSDISTAATTSISTMPDQPDGPTRRTMIRTLLVVVALVVTFAGAVGIGGLAWGIGSLRIAAHTQVLPPGMQSLTIDAGATPLVIRLTADRDVREPQVRMRLLRTTQSSETALNVVKNGDIVGLTVAGAPSPVFDFGPPGEITVTLPPDMAHRLSVSTKQQKGMLLAQTELDQLTVRSTEGSVSLDGAARRIEVHTTSGEIRTRQPISVTESFLAESDNGHIAVDFRDAAPRVVQATARDTDIAIDLPPEGPYFVRARAGEKVTVRVPQTDDLADAAAQITARTDDGSVLITTRR